MKFHNMKVLKACNFIKKVSNTGIIFLWILRIFSEHLSRKTSANDCFYFLTTAEGAERILKVEFGDLKQGDLNEALFVKGILSI